jgi:formate hydrogenlyase subunit 6/NADH:ubiquinone oxidoreductase subunit I
MYYTLKKSDLPKFINLLKKDFEVIAPVKKRGSIFFDEISSANEIAKNYINTDYPPKNFFLPDGETLFEFKKSKKIEISYPNENKKRVIYGIRPCDANALLKLDKILGGEYYYRTKRENTRIIVINCNKAGENCFCTSFGDDQAKEFDLLLTDLGKEFYIKVGSEWGKEIVKARIFRKTNKSFRRNFLECKRYFLAKGIEKRIEKIFNTKVWDKHFKKCFSCTACSVVCPLCYCFDLVHLPESKDRGKVKRFLSSCLSREFSRVAGSFVFRSGRVERVRQFVSHKFFYAKKNHDEYLCVGCGRCTTHCPVNIDFEKFLEEIR